MASQAYPIESSHFYAIMRLLGDAIRAFSYDIYRGSPHGQPPLIIRNGGFVVRTVTMRGVVATRSLYPRSRVSNARSSFAYTDYGIPHLITRAYWYLGPQIWDAMPLIGGSAPRTGLPRPPHLSIPKAGTPTQFAYVIFPDPDVF